ncbi:hypothetical protein O9H85_29280 [Paenibacillus filicis]|uniref:Uncharacterized protein n=2 Tax=Paenibacillus gyeongsangnamensis TaxID=3388067 RepID=A0ABT4QHS2_9BACL|nr:hypothetical protein [Paenibacillus filicis]
MSRLRDHLSLAMCSAMTRDPLAMVINLDDKLCNPDVSAMLKKSPIP